MDMTDMKFTPAEKKEMAEGNCGCCPQPATSYDGPNYPWGLEIRLEKEAMDKLGLKAADYNVGDYVIVTARCCVKELRQSDRQGGKPSQTMELQIEEMSMADDTENQKDEDLSWEDDRKTAEKKLKKKGLA